MKHEDNRRALTEFGNGRTWKVCKVIEAKENCYLGNHYHKKKDESFMLIKGDGEIKTGGNSHKMQLFEEYFVPAYIRHEFFLITGSILIGLCSEEFNPKDDYNDN